MKLINQNGIVPNGFNCRSSSIDKQTRFLWAWEVRTTNIITCLTIRLTCRSSVSVVWNNTTMLILRMKSASLSPHLLPFRGPPGRKYYTSSLNAAIRYPLKRNELHQIYKQGATFPHIRHFCTSFSSADLSSSCSAIPHPYPTVADIIIGRRGTKRKFSRSSESFCTTRLKKVTSIQLLILVGVALFFFVGKKFSYPTQYVITTTKLNWNKGLPEIIIYHNCSVTMHIYLAEALQFIHIVIYILISCSHFCRTISLDLHLAVLKYQPHTQHEVLCMIRDSLNPLYSIRYNTSLSRWWWICSWLKLSSRTNSSSSPFNQIKWIISSAGVTLGNNCRLEFGKDSQIGVSKWNGFFIEIFGLYQKETLWSVSKWNWGWFMGEKAPVFQMQYYSQFIL